MARVSQSQRSAQGVEDRRSGPRESNEAIRVDDLVASINATGYTWDRDTGYQRVASCSLEVSIESDEEAVIVSGLLSEWRGVASRVAAYYKRWKDPVNKIRAAILANEKRDADLCARKIAAATNALNDWRAEKEAARVAAQRALEAAEAAQARAGEAIGESDDYDPIEVLSTRQKAAGAVEALDIDPELDAIPIDAYSARVDDAFALVCAIAAGAVSIDAFIPNMALLNDYARQSGEALNIPGVSVVKTTTYRRKSSRS